METRARYAIIGAFTLVVIVLCFVFVYWLKRLDETGIRSTVYFEFEGTVGGLAPGGAIYFAGIKVGTVTSLEFDQTDPNKVLVTAEVREDTPVKVDSRAEVGSNLLTGVAFIEMSGGTGAAQSIFDADPPLIIGSRSAISDAISAASSTIVKIEEIATRIDEFIAVNQETITQTAANVEAFTGALAENADGVQDFLANVAKMSETVGALADRLTEIVGKANDIISAVDPERVASVVRNADEVVRDLRAASDDIEQITGTVKGAADEISAFTEGLNKTLADVQEVVGSIDRNKVAGVVDNVSGFADRLSVVGPQLDEAIANVKEIAANAKAFTDNLNARNDDINQIVANVRDLSDQLKGTSEKLDAVLVKANDFLGSGGGEEGKSFFTEATAAARSIRSVAQKLDAQSGQILGGIAQFSGRGLQDLTTLINELRQSVRRIDRAVVDFSSNPTGAVFGGNSGVREYNRR